MKYFLTKDKLTEVVLFALIILLASFLRLWQIDNNPPGLFVDEVSNGYNAYSLLKTWKDEYGNFLPLTIRAFGDYNPALSVYLLIPSIAIFGLTDFAVRFPSALLGVITVASLFFLSQILFNSKKIAYLSSLLLAISPWHLQFSRYDHEANFMLAFSIIGITFFLYSKKHKSFLNFSALSFALSLNSYHGAKIWVPLIIFALMFIYNKELLQAKKKLITPLIIIAIATIPVFLNLERSLIRAESVGILKSGDSKLKVFTEGYLSHFSPNFLFIRGDLIGRHSVNEMGQLYLFELPLILLGIISAINTKNKSRELKLLLVWLLLSPVPAALASPTPHALRAINVIPVFAMISAYGFKVLQDSKYPKIIKRLTYCGITIIAFYNISTYFHLYYIHEPKLKAADWRFGYKQTISAIESVREKNQSIPFTNYYTHPYIYVLFYTKYDPYTFQQDQNKDKIGDYEFFGENWKKPDVNKVIMARAPWQVTYNKNLKILKNINSPSGETFFVITEE